MSTTFPLHIQQTLELFDRRLGTRPLGTLTLTELNCDGCGSQARFVITGENGSRAYVATIGEQFTVTLRRVESSVASVTMMSMDVLNRSVNMCINGNVTHRVKG